MSGKSDIFLHVHTGDKENAGTNANVKVILYDQKGNRSATLAPDNIWNNDFERGCVDVFQLSESEVKGLDVDGGIVMVEFWRDEAGWISTWYVKMIRVENKRTDVECVFPFFRWVRPYYHYRIMLNDTFLPQSDQLHEQRKADLEWKRKNYGYSQLEPGLPVQIESMPDDEKFSWDYTWDIAQTKAELLIISRLEALIGKTKELFGGGWGSLDDLLDVYQGEHFPKPKGVSRWRDDMFFGLQRTSSLNNCVIELCTAVPDKLPVDDSMVGPSLEGLTLQQALQQRRLFICDLHILQDLPVRENYTLCVPICLLFLNKDKQLKPVAIQLFQTPAPDNPIFLPTDDPWLWTLAKMWYNNADAAYHQGLTHLGFTHLLMEGVAIATHRQLSQSHPLFKLLAPHFLYVIAINKRAVGTLLAEGGWVDNGMSFGTRGLLELVKKGMKIWRMDVHGTLPEDLKRRGLDDPAVLPCYHFREDALPLYHAIHRYVTAYVNLYYDAAGNSLRNDKEVQAWALELVKPRDSDSERCGCGLLGVPGDGLLTSLVQLTTILTSIIFTSSVMHASANFAQYDEYAFPPNYPGLLRGQPPKTKDAVTETDIVNTLPDRTATLDIMVVTRILSRRTMNSLGYFEVNYIFDPKATDTVKQFRQELSRISLEVEERNELRPVPYTDLDPVNVPNSISI